MGYGEEIKRILGRNIANARRDAKLNQRMLADQIGVTRQMMCQIEAGKKQVPDALMKKIASALDVRPKDLLTGHVWHEPMNAPGIEVVMRFDSDEDHVAAVELLQPYLQLSEEERQEVRHLIDVLHLKATMARVGKVTDAFSDGGSDLRKVKTKANC